MMKTSVFDGRVLGNGKLDYCIVSSFLITNEVIIRRMVVMCISKSKAVPLHAMEAQEWRGGIEPTHT
jgi:hypothetical protein